MDSQNWLLLCFSSLSCAVWMGGLCICKCNLYTFDLRGSASSSKEVRFLRKLSMPVPIDYRAGEFQPPSSLLMRLTCSLIISPSAVESWWSYLTTSCCSCLLGREVLTGANKCGMILLCFSASCLQRKLCCPSQLQSSCCLWSASVLCPLEPWGELWKADILFILKSLPIFVINKKVNQI